MKAKLCRCNNCDTIMIDQNPKPNNPELEVPDNAAEMQFVDGIDGGFWACPVCEDDCYLMDVTEQSQIPAPSTPVNEVKDKQPDISELKQNVLNKCDEALKLNSGIGNFGAPDKQEQTQQVKGQLFLDEGDFERTGEPDELYIRGKLNDETFDVCNFGCNDTNFAKDYATSLVTRYNQAPTLYRENKELKEMLTKIYCIENAAFGLKSFDVVRLKADIANVLYPPYQKP